MKMSEKYNSGGLKWRKAVTARFLASLKGKIL